MTPAEMAADTVRPGQVCSCCHQPISEDEWLSLPHPPNGALMEDGDGGYLELRNHPCRPGGATISRPAAREIRGFEVA